VQVTVIQKVIQVTDLSSHNVLYILNLESPIDISVYSRLCSVSSAFMFCIVDEASGY
jgi:hypothetical protein